MNGEIDDKAFDDYLKRGSPVSQHYQALGSDETPADIDRQILARAEEAVHSPSKRKTRVWQRWSVPVALAASTVLAVSIVIESGQHQSTLIRGPSYAEPERDTPSASHQVEEPSVESQAVKPVAAPNAAREEARSDAAARGREAAALREQVQRRSAARALSAPASTEAPAKHAGPKTESGVAADTRAERAREKKEDDLGDQGTQPASPAPTPVPVPAFPPHEVQRSSPAPTSASIETPGFVNQKQHVDAQRSDPEAWLREIRTLRAAGKTKEADREWKAFRESFPDHFVAADDPAMGP